MAAPQVSDLSALLLRTVDPGQGSTVLATVQQIVNAYVRGVGFDSAGVPNADLGAVILSASARLLANPSQLLTDQTLGPSSVSYRSAFQGFTVAELATLDRYRVKAV